MGTLATGYVITMELCAVIFVPAMVIISMVEKADKRKARRKNRRRARDFKNAKCKLNVIRVLNEDIK